MEGMPCVQSRIERVPCFKKVNMRLLTHPKLEFLSSGITRSQNVFFHQFFQISEIGLGLSLKHADEKRLGQLEEATGLEIEGEVEPCSPFNLFVCS